MATKQYTRTAWTEEEIDAIMKNKGIDGYSEKYYSGKWSFTDADGREVWAVNVKEYYGQDIDNESLAQLVECPTGILICINRNVDHGTTNKGSDDDAEILSILRH